MKRKHSRFFLTLASIMVVLMLGFLVSSFTKVDAKTIKDKVSILRSTKTPIEKYGQLSVSGRYMKDKNGNDIVLHGQGFGWSTWWPQYWNANVV